MKQKSAQNSIHPHPIYVYYDAKKWVILLAIPILRAFFSKEDVVILMIKYMRDITIAFVLIGYSWLKWSKTHYRLDGSNISNQGLNFQQGVFRKNKLKLMARHAASVEIERTLIMWATGSRRVRINTAGNRRKSDATLYLHDEAVSTKISNLPHVRRYAAQIFPVAILSASSSNAAIGFLTMSPALRNAGDILGRNVSDEFAGILNQVLQLGLPPLLDSLANLFVLGWVLAFIRTFSRYVGFYAEREHGQLHLISGLTTRRDVFIDTNRITTLQIRQTLFMRIFRLYSASITAAGYGRERGARPVIVPAASYKQMNRAVNNLLPEYPRGPNNGIKPAKTAIMGYIGPPLAICAVGILPLLIGGAISMVAVVIFIIGGWWLLIRLTGFFRANFCVGEKAISMRYARGYALHEVHIPLEVIDVVRIKQSWFQTNTCTLIVMTFGENKRKHKLKGMPQKQAHEAVKTMMKVIDNNTK